MKKNTFQSGQGLIEYALVMVMVAVVVAIIASVIRAGISNDNRIGLPGVTVVQVPQDACTENGAPKIIDVDYDFSSHIPTITYVDRKGDIVVIVKNRGGVWSEVVRVVGGGSCLQ